MRSILFYLTRYPAISGGIEKVTTYMANELSSREYNVIILSVYHQEAEDKIYELPNDKVHIHNLPDGMDNLLSETNVKYINDLIKYYNVDTIVYQDSYANSYPLLRKVEKRVRVIVAEHNMPNYAEVALQNEFKYKKIDGYKDLVRKIFYPTLMWKNKRAIRRRHREIYKMSDLYVVLASGYVDKVKKLAGTNDENGKLMWINNPVTIKIPEQVDWKEKQKDILFVGRLEAQKGIRFLLDIWGDFCKHRLDYRLNIVGDGPLRLYAEGRVGRENIPNVFFRGNTSDVNRFYRGGVILCMTSIYEGWPLVLAEAMAHGVVPIAFSTFDAITDIIENDVNGVTIQPFDKIEYVKRLCQLADDENKRIALATAGRLKAETLSVTRIVDTWTEIL